MTATGRCTTGLDKRLDSPGTGHSDWAAISLWPQKGGCAIMCGRCHKSPLPVRTRAPAPRTTAPQAMLMPACHTKYRPASDRGRRRPGLPGFFTVGSASGSSSGLNRPECLLSHQRNCCCCYVLVVLLQDTLLDLMRSGLLSCVWTRCHQIPHTPS